MDNLILRTLLHTKTSHVKPEYIKDLQLSPPNCAYASLTEEIKHHTKK